MVEVSANQTQCLEEILQRVASDLAMIADREFVVESVAVERADQRPAGAGQVHISFRIGLRTARSEHHGCLLVPLPDAITLACCLMMLPEDAVRAARTEVGLDSTTKDAMLEVGNFITGATDAALRALGVEGVQVVFEGCQGVRADVRPAFVYREGDPLVVARASARLAQFPSDTLLLMLPEAALGEVGF